MIKCIKEDIMDYLARMAMVYAFSMCIFVSISQGAKRESTPISRDVEQQKLEDKKTAEKLSKTDFYDARTGGITLPEDSSPKMAVKSLKITGNTLISTIDLITSIPDVFVNPGKPVNMLSAQDIYDLSSLKKLIAMPGVEHQVSAKSIQGLTMYLLTAYSNEGYSGIYVYVPKEAQALGKFEGGVLPIKIVEGRVSEVNISYRDPDDNELEKGHIRESVFREWMPVKEGDVINKKELDDFFDLLNLNPDRYVSAKISRGEEQESLSLEYQLYEANPWHYFIQVDNAGRKDRQWAPKVGFINTDLTGTNDTFLAMTQFSVDRSTRNNNSFYVSYEFPIFTPKLRLKPYFGRSEFITDAGGSDFLGNGKFWGAILTYTLYQQDSWFFDATASLSREESETTPELFPSLGSNVDMDMWSVGFDIHHRDDVSNTSFVFNRQESMGGSSQASFTRARTGAQRDFTIVTFRAMHNRYLDSAKVQRVNGTFQMISPGERLVPAKMTSFGGMYTVRGYQEDAIVADGGLLYSFQYEYDLIAKEEETANMGQPTFETEETETESYFKKIAPLVFADFGRAKIKHAVAGEKGVEELCSVGVGVLLQAKKNLSAALYYGIPLRETDKTDIGEGRVNVSVTLRW